MRTPSLLRALAAAVFTAVGGHQALAAPQAAPLPATPPRNIIFVLVDDLRFDAMGFLTPGLQTPHIDQLAREGVYFPNAVVTSSLCSPSRATILTGQTARNHGIIDNNDSSEAGLTFFPQYLQARGYQTGFFGKWHMGSATDAPRPGFNHWLSFTGQGHYFPTSDLSPERVQAGEVNTFNIDGKRVPQKGYVTDELTDYALDWLEHGRDKNKPFFLYLSHKAVHSDPLPAPRHAQQYQDLDIRLPASLANTDENNEGKPIWVRNQRNSWHGADFPYHTDIPLKEYVRNYYRTLSAVDDSVGRLLEYLQRHRLDKNTLVVFYSDNGFLIGDHGLIDKRNAYQPSVRVPMVAWAPGLLPRGAVNPVRVRNLDLAPTFLDVAGAPQPKQFEGRSILPAATGQQSVAAFNADDFVYEYYWEWSFPQTPTTFAIQHGDMKYIQYHGVWDIEELYDLKNDPDEMHNLIDDPRQLQTKMDLRKRLFQQLADNKGKHVVPYSERTSTGLVWRNANGPKVADFPKQWQVAPNRPDKMNGLYRDGPAKLKADQAGQTYRPGPPPKAAPAATSASQPSR